MDVNKVIQMREEFTRMVDEVITNEVTRLLEEEQGAISEWSRSFHAYDDMPGHGEWCLVSVKDMEGRELIPPVGSDDYDVWWESHLPVAELVENIAQNEDDGTEVTVHVSDGSR